MPASPILSFRHPRLAALALALPAFAILPTAVRADTEVAMPDVENSKMSMVGIISQNNVFVRSGPGDNYYPTQRLERGTKITVVGFKADWLKIIPPEGSFCYVSKAYVEKRGDGTVGRVTKDAVNVRAGSSLNQMKIVPLCQLAAGADVAILGDQDEYFKIKPPEKAYLFVNRQFVEQDPNSIPVAQKPDRTPRPADEPKAAPPTVADRTPPADPPTGTTPLVPAPPAGDTPAPTTGTSDPIVTAAPTGGTAIHPRIATAAPTTRPTGATGSTASDAPAAPPAAPETAADLETLFTISEGEFQAASTKPLTQQPLESLLKSYGKLAASDKLLPSMHQIAEARLKSLQLRQELAQQDADLKKAQEDMRRRDVALRGEREELEQRLAANTITVYAAVGTLQPSSLQRGNVNLFRLTDPANGRTICYLRTDDSKYLAYLNQFIGVRGELTTDAGLGLKVITPTDAAPVDQTKVNGTITAQITPPSLRPKPAQVSTNN